MVSDPCPHWAVFRMLGHGRTSQPASQISVLIDGERALLYCCHSLRTRDMAGNPHVLSVGIDLLPALESQGFDAEAIVESIHQACRRHSGKAAVPAAAATAIRAVGRVLNIAWVGEALESPASVICPRSNACPRTPTCSATAPASRTTEISAVRQQILDESRRRNPG
jgi:hypothetical protein